MVTLLSLDWAIMYQESSPKAVLPYFEFANNIFIKCGRITLAAHRWYIDVRYLTPSEEIAVTWVNGGPRIEDALRMHYPCCCR